MRNLATLVCVLLSVALLGKVEAWRYEQSILPPEKSEGVSEYGAILSDIVAYSNGTVLFAASSRNRNAFVIRNGHSYHKWVQIRYEAISETNTKMHTDSIGLTEKVIFISIKSEDETTKEIKYAWIGEKGKKLEPAGPMNTLYRENKGTGRKELFFAVSRDSIYVAAYITTVLDSGPKVGIVNYWTRDGMLYKRSGRYVFLNDIANEKISFMKFLKYYVILGTYNNETNKNVVYVVNNGDMRSFTVDCPEGTVIGTASTYDTGSLLAVSCVCPYNESRRASPAEDPCVATVFVYNVTFERTNQLAALNNSGYANPNFDYGKSVCIYKDTIVVGSPYYREVVEESKSEAHSDCGNIEADNVMFPFIYLYRNYKLEKRVYMNSEIAKNGFGATVSVMGDFLAASTPYEENGPGRIYLFSVSQFSAETIGLIIFGFLIVSILVVLSVLTYYKLHPMSVSAVPSEIK